MFASYLSGDYTPNWPRTYWPDPNWPGPYWPKPKLAPTQIGPIPNWPGPKLAPSQIGPDPKLAPAPNWPQLQISPVLKLSQFQINLIKAPITYITYRIFRIKTMGPTVNEGFSFFAIFQFFVFPRKNDFSSFFAKFCLFLMIFF